MSNSVFKEQKERIILSKLDTNIIPLTLVMKYG